LTRQQQAELVALLIEEYHCARPGLREFYSGLLEARKAGTVHSIVMCTAAPNGWPQLLADALHVWYHGDAAATSEKLYDLIVCKEELEQYSTAAGKPAVVTKHLRVAKRMDYIRKMLGLPQGWRVVMVDDFPEAVKDATDVLRVAPFEWYLDMDRVVFGDSFTKFLEDHGAWKIRLRRLERAYPTLRESLSEILQGPKLSEVKDGLPSHDTDLQQALEAIRALL
jgi:hypothetical protein